MPALNSPLDYLLTSTSPSLPFLPSFLPSLPPSLFRWRKTVAVFCHGGFGLTWLARLLQMPVSQVWSSFYLAPSSVTTVLFDERSLNKAVPRAISVGETGHLYAAGLKTAISKYEKPNVFSSEPRPSGIKANFF